MAVPEPMPVTIPVEPAVATSVLLLLHVPPAGVAERLTEDPVHTVLLPVTEGVAFTVNDRVT